MTDNLKEREAFEAQYRKDNDGSGLYCEAEWRGWKRRAALVQAQSLPAGWEALLKDAYLSGFAAPATYNDKVENDAEEEYARWRAASPQPSELVRFGGRCEKHLRPKPCEQCAQAKPEQAAQPMTRNQLFEFWGNCDAIPGDSIFPDFEVYAKELIAEFCRVNGITLAAPQPKD